MGAFESPTAPGKHDGARIVQTVLELYDAATTLGPAIR
jgi:hypothetical protein